MIQPIYLSKIEDFGGKFTKTHLKIVTVYGFYHA